MTFTKTTSQNPDYQQLVVLLDKYLAVVDGDDHAFYDQYNKSDSIRHVVVAYENDVAVGCGAFKFFEGKTVEIKRMFVHPDHRNKGIAGNLVRHLEQWAAEESYKYAVLETGKRQYEAIALYLKLGYEITENYGQYIGVDNSVCMKKKI